MSDVLWLPQPVTALDMIAAERRRQVESLSYSAERDDVYVNGELSMAAVAYTEAGRMRKQHGRFWFEKYKDTVAAVCCWPWGAESFKPAYDDTIDSRIRELTKAGALIIAEIERLQRLQRLHAKDGAA